MLHRDLKPSNILVTPSGVAKVSDFGLARSIQRAEGETPTTQVIGTPGYMSPEQATGTELNNPSIDVYGLGAVLYSLVTGRAPFRADTPIGFSSLSPPQIPCGLAGFSRISRRTWKPSACIASKNRPAAVTRACRL